MKGVLHITNGDIAADLLRRSQVMGDVLPWRDALHEGPAPAGLDLPALSAARARFVDEARLAPGRDLAREFSERDAVLAAAESVVLWFEHDLYDQLQLLQLLDWFSTHPPAGSLELIEVGEFPGVEKFVGLGQLSPAQLGSLHEARRPVTAAQTALAARAWAAFRSADPTGLPPFLTEDTFDLPFLQDALLRHLQEFPSAEDGLPRTERQLLESATADRTLLHLFRSSQAREERPFMGDAIVKYRLSFLAGGRAPLVTGRGRRLSFDAGGPAFWEQEAVLTDAGRRALAGGGDWFADAGLTRWLGGARVAPDAAWRRSRDARILTKPGAPRIVD